MDGRIASGHDGTGALYGGASGDGVLVRDQAFEDGVARRAALCKTYLQQVLYRGQSICSLRGGLNGSPE
jgi:hypothetical protein